MPPYRRELSAPTRRSGQIALPTFITFEIERAGYIEICRHVVAFDERYAGRVALKYFLRLPMTFPMAISGKIWRLIVRLSL